ncbi:peptidase [Planctomicrobium sp. SH668]|uniref:peptidase n=1 Tax=Planctomicrobium sp. SH668 TaxID=3448126 RepID=UPI003F5B7281
MTIGTDRRTFLKAAGTSALAIGIAPAFLGATDKAGKKPVVIGNGDYLYECHHLWGEVPDHIQYLNTHGTAVGKDGLVYISHQGRGNAPCDVVVVFEPSGKFVRSFGKEYAGAGHGIDLREEGGTEFVYLSNTSNQSVVKCTTDGEVVWKKLIPEEPHLYDEPTAAAIQAAKDAGSPAPARPNYSPTNVCFGPHGGFYIGDGYGSNYIHQYDLDGKWIRSFGGSGQEAGKMVTPHGQWIDTRGGEHRLVVADRANVRLQYFTLDGKPVEIFQGVPEAEKEKAGTKGVAAVAGGGEVPVTYFYGMGFPANVETQGDLLLVPDLHARIILMNVKNEIVANLGFDEEWTRTVLDGFKVRGQDPAGYPAGKFVHPHDATFDADGNIYVAEWVDRGRLTFLKKV